MTQVWEQLEEQKDFQSEMIYVGRLQTDGYICYIIIYENENYVIFSPGS